MFLKYVFLRSLIRYFFELQMKIVHSLIFRGGYMVPKYILFLDELQQTSTGKPSKKEIRDLHLSTIERLEI